jgi:hypothetical protein
MVNIEIIGKGFDGLAECCADVYPRKWNNEGNSWVFQWIMQRTIIFMLTLLKLKFTEH